MASSRKSSSSSSSAKKAKGRQPELLSAAYLTGSSNKNELLRRLSLVADALSSLPEDVDPTSHSGLLSLSSALVSPSILDHKDKDVRLRAVLCACELFYAFAPEPPWDARDTVRIFGQLIRQLGNLHATPPEGANFGSYYRILEQLSEVKIGVVLVDLIRTERGGRESHANDLSFDATANDATADDGAGEDSPLDALCSLLRTLLSCVHVDHPPEVAGHAELAAAACVEEFEGSVPPRVLEELLIPIGRGPVAWVTNPAYAAVAKRRTKSPGSGGKGGGKKKKGAKDGNDAKGGEEDEAPLPPPQIQQTNPSYLVSARVLRRTEDKVSSPVAALLNGLLAGDPLVTNQTSISTVDAEAARLLAPPARKRRKKPAKGSDDDDAAKESPTLAAHLEAMDATKDAGANVYAISYELHRVVPRILTTVVGTASASLTSPDVARRWQAARLLGRLFGARGSDIAGRFGPCFREWVRRSYDPEPKVRETMVKCLVNFLVAHHDQADLCADVNEALAAVVVRDPVLDVRLQAIHQTCDLAHAAVPSGAEGSAAGAEGEDATKRRGHPISVVSADLLRAIGNRVSSKDKTEHRDAMTGLAQVYHKHYLRRRVRFVQEGGDDVPIEEILEVWGEGRNEAEEEKFGWIPQKVFECVSYPDATDAEMRNRVFQIVDDVLLGTSKKDSLSGSNLTPTSRAVGLALIMESVKQKDNAYKWMCALFTQRGRLQKALGAYLDARSKAKECESGSAEAFDADNDAKEKLELVATLTAPVAEGTPNGKSNGGTNLEAILKKFHTAKDRHIFRILSTICDPTHSPSARARALDELPKRTKGLGGPAQGWVKTLARRCAMGAFLNAEGVEHCIILSQEAFESEDCAVSSGFLECVKVATTIFPGLGGTEGGFKNLVEFFDAVRTADLSSSTKKEMEKHGIVTSLSEILARSGPKASHPAGKKDAMDFDDDDDGKSSFDTLHEQLLRLCTRDGTPEQARNSVYTISSMIKPASQSTPGSEAIASHVGKEKKEFEPLLKALTNASRLSIPDQTASVKAQGRIVSVLSAIAAIADCAPYAFNAPGQGGKLGWGRKALNFCLDTVLLGKNARLKGSSPGKGDSGSDEGSEEEETPAKKGRTKSAKRGASNAKGKGNDVSVHCQMICGAVEVLVSHIRSNIMNSHQGDSGRRGKGEGQKAPKLPVPSSVRQVFSALVQILEDGGVPPSSVDGQYCNTRQDKAELRRCASVNLLRLCDSNLKLEGKYLTARMWHILSSALLDEDKNVRGAVMEELSFMLTAGGKFRAHGSAQLAPSLRFVSMVTLCADGEHGGHSAANAGAANVGQKKTNGTKNAAAQCIKNLRTTCQEAAAACRSSGRSAEKNFETRLKVRLMPEYCVPYALHLLAFRHETASAAGTLAGENDDSASDVSDEGDEEEGISGKVVHSQEASQRMLKKRLKRLLDPLIQSLGAGADNISFLLRMVELISKHPLINVLKSAGAEVASLDLDDEDQGTPHKHDDEKEAEARMKIICQFSREVLLSHVKKDVNLTTYPGSIQIPGDLYRARISTSPPPRGYESVESDATPKKKPKKSISHYVKKRDKKVSLALDDTIDVEDNLEADHESGSDKSEEKPDSRGEQSPGKSADKKPDKAETQLTYEHDSPSLSPDASPAAEDKEAGKDFGDISPISMANDSPAAVDKARVVSRGGRRKRSSASTDKKKKRKSNEIEVFDELLSPATDVADGEASPPDDGKAMRRKVHASNKRHRPTTPKVPSSKKPKATPVSVPKSVMVNVTNSTAPSSSSGAAAATARYRKKSAGSKEKQKLESSFDFSDSAAKQKVKPRSRKKSAGSEKKVTPARKAQAPSKVKVSSAKTSGRKKAKSMGTDKPVRKSNVTVKAKSTPKAAVASTKAGKASGKSKAKAGKALSSASGKAASQRGKATPQAASPSTTSEATSRGSPVRRSTRRAVRA